MVVDTSVLLAVFFAEPHGDWAAARLAEHASELRMSTVNLTETLIRVRDRQPQLYETIESELLRSGIRFVPPDVEQARIAAEARLRYPMNLGDCFAYALARSSLRKTAVPRSKPVWRRDFKRSRLEETYPCKDRWTEELSS